VGYPGTRRIAKLTKGVAALDKSILHASAALEQEKQELGQESFFRRHFGAHKSHEASGARLLDLRQRKAQLDSLAQKLHTAIDSTPRSAEEKSLLVKELRLRKKELQAEKREASAAMTSIRKEARVESVHAGKTWLGLYDSSLAAAQRRAIRYAKEAALNPHEDSKAAIERQIAQVERDILWLERFQ